LNEAFSLSFMIMMVFDYLRFKTSGSVVGKWDEDSITGFRSGFTRSYHDVIFDSYEYAEQGSSVRLSTRASL